MNRKGRVAGGIILGACAICLGVHVFRTGSIEAAAGWFVIATFFIALTVLLFVSPTTTKSPIPIATLEGSRDNDLVEVMRSSDPSAVEVAHGALVASGISAVVLGEHSARILGYMPAIVSLRVMVPAKDAPRSIELLRGES